MAGRRRFTSGSTRRQTSWEGGPATGTNGSVESLTASANLVFNTGVIALIDGLTLVRTRGEFVAYLKTASAAGAGYAGAFGIGIVNENAFGIGATAILAPIDDEEWDGWLYHRFFSLTAADVIDGSVSADVDAINSVSAAVRLEVDSKAMRKIEAEEVLFAAVQVTEALTATVDFAFNSRLLFKLA